MSPARAERLRQEMEKRARKVSEAVASARAKWREARRARRDEWFDVAVTREREARHRLVAARIMFNLNRKLKELTK